ncbi:nucleotide sugar epimerase [Dissulfurispira thermophila]|uniref:Nucleotide sugar epimerase n=2 Tax=root TaxID=1 RepID=A0A7G1H4G8_9BACT|nr:GDP-mannose 4,6-dehydratase [Dissulfurispira thermophila]BCB97099.1 nucleotide sugar epimerase [Dissulfurispira thermophila]
MRNILVTGCCGFIGYKVSELLLEHGESVIGVDNINDYYDPKLKEWRLEKLKDKGQKSKGGFNFHICDIGDFNSVKTICSNYKIDAVINLAARAGVRASVEDPWAYLDTNLKGTLNLLECSKTYEIKKFVLASTSSVYGDNTKMPFSVGDNTDHALAPYSATKKGAEVMCYSYHYLYGIDITVFRYFTVYGPAGRPDMSIFKFIKNIDLCKPIPIFGNGKQKRDFTYIDDIADGTIKGLKNVGYEIFNLGNDRPVELMYVINMIEKKLGKKAEIQWLPLHPADIAATWADINSSKERLGWSPKTSIEDGIEQTVNWYIQNRDFVRNLKDAQ